MKALGFLSNKGTDNFSGRIITVNGKITAEQHKKIAEPRSLRSGLTQLLGQPPTAILNLWGRRTV